jgi:hypothetical protein
MFSRTIIRTVTHPRFSYRANSTIYQFSTAARTMAHQKTLTEAIKEDHEEVSQQ